MGGKDEEVAAMEIVLEDGVTLTVDLDSGEKRLNELGYEQSLQRTLNWFEVFSSAYNCSSYLAIIPFFALVFLNSGPAGMVWYWVVVGFFTGFLALSLAEIASSFPVAGSFYFWAAYMSPKKWSPLFAFVTGWLEFISEAVLSASGAIQTAQVIQTIVFVWTGGAVNPETSVLLSNAQLFAISAAIMVLCCLLLLMPIKQIGIYLAMASVYETVVTVVAAIAIPIISPTTQPASWVFGHYETLFDITNTPSAGYAAILSCLLGQFTLYFFECCSHLSEEVKRADSTVPSAIVWSWGLNVLFGLGLIIALLFSIQGDGSNLFAPDTITGGSAPVFQILWDSFGGRSELGAYIIYIAFGVVTINVAASILLPSARTIFALARDNGLPFSQVFYNLNRSKVPVAAVVLSTGVAIVSCCLIFVSTNAFASCSTTATSLSFMCYCITIGLRTFTPEDKFVPGPFHLAKWLGNNGGKAVHCVALVYSLYTVVVFNLPTTFPVTSANFNWTPVGIAITFLVLSLWWVTNARFWFVGPNISATDHQSAH